jgi:His/Glu/Gln/Arg/opine family amino acid ABC transporter permease subunit
MNSIEFLIQLLPNLLLGFPSERPGGLLLSLLLTLGAVVGGFGLAVFIALLRLSRWRVLRWGAIGYINVLRGVPLVLLLLLIHQGIGGQRFGMAFSPPFSAWLTLTLYFAAYLAAVLYSGLVIVPTPLLEAARLIGASPVRVFWEIRLRYALRVTFPAISSEAISLFKDTSVLVVLGVGELMTVARASLGSDVRNSAYWVAVYLLVGAVYATIALTLSRWARRWENQAPRYIFQQL